jgi:hypothetical protein
MLHAKHGPNLGVSKGQHSVLWAAKVISVVICIIKDAAGEKDMHLNNVAIL